MAMNYLERANELAAEITADRRYLHQHPETGIDTPVTTAYVKEKLTVMGYTVSGVGPGLVATVGKGNPVIMLRADIDALPMTEDSGLDFASLNQGKAHCCGHDMHTAMLLGAARLLKENEDCLKGTVKLMFQSGEETGGGVSAMIKAGLMENPKPDVAMAFHVDALLPFGRFNYGKGATFCSNDVFIIDVLGKPGHGARPHQAVDAINASAHIITGMETLISRETAPDETCILTVCSIESDTKAFNVFPQKVTMTGTLRTYNPERRAMLLRRIEEVVTGIAGSFRCEGILSYQHHQEPLLVDDDMESEMRGYLEELLGESGRFPESPIRKLGSEDFADVTMRVPSAYFFIGAGPDRENGYLISQHNPKVRFNEDILPLGAAGFAYCAAKWLETHSGKK